MAKPLYVVMEHHSVRSMPVCEVRDNADRYYDLAFKEDAWIFPSIWDGYNRVRTGTMREVVDWARATHGEEIAQAILDAAVECERIYRIPDVHSSASPPAATHPSCGRVLPKLATSSRVLEASQDGLAVYDLWRFPCPSP